MPSLRTEVSEIVTGLGMLGIADLDRALAARPAGIVGVTDAHFERLSTARDDPKLSELFDAAWKNGVSFSRSDEGLRGRPPWSIEWLGPFRPADREMMPTDLRVDHVYLVSCKYGSDILLNASPAHLFDRLLEQRRGPPEDWFARIAPVHFQELYRATLDAVDAGSGFPDLVGDLTAAHRERLKPLLRGSSWPDGVGEIYRSFAEEVGAGSARHWRSQMGRQRERVEMLWRLLRLQPVSYFVLGAGRSGPPVAIRTMTPFDHLNSFDLTEFEIEGERAGQPRVSWTAQYLHKASGQHHRVAGHVEIRWSHGRFSGAPEAKVYLDTPHHEVPGYIDLADARREPQIAAGPARLW